MILKFWLNMSKAEQRKQLLERIDEPNKNWKFNPRDVDERELWDDYMAAYQVALTRTSTETAPWHVVPSNRKWFARLAVQHLLLEALEGIDPQWPAATFDVDVEKVRLAAT